MYERHRHTRDHIYTERLRHIRRREQLFRNLWRIEDSVWHWDDRENPKQTLRPKEVVLDEFWNANRVGKFAKWNGVCSCGLCRARKTRQDRPRLKREFRKEYTPNDLD